MPPRRQVKARSPELAALGEAIRRTRDKAELTQEQLADLMDSESSQLGLLERGLGNPSYTTLTRVAKALETQVGALTSLADEINARRRSD
jgi:transcriptional regulator with XRE-family HTH domain